MKRKWFTFFLVAAFTAAAGLAWGAPAWADDTADDTAEPTAPVATTDADPSVASETDAELTESLPIYGMQVWIDEETGQMRAPTAAEAAYVANLTRRMFATKAQAAPKAVVHENGMTSVELGTEFLEFSMVRILPDGSLEHECVDHAEHVHSFLAHSAQPAAREEQ